jgi:[ribosomal protein S5]-alanine N-acetyltransferase
MTDTVFTTPRLNVRRWRRADIDDLFGVYADAQAMRWVGDGRPITPAQCEQWLQVTRANYARRGYGMFALELRDTGLLAGFAGIVHPGDQLEAEVKYALHRAHWGRGLATEALQGLLAYGRDAHALRRIIATTAPQNHASHRVLVKAGLRRGVLRDDGDGSWTQCFEWIAGH